MLFCKRKKRLAKNHQYGFRFYRVTQRSVYLINFLNRRKFSMVFAGVLIAVIIMGAVIFMALTKKSDFHTRLVSLGALALMILTLIICLVIVLTDNRVPVDESILIVGAPPEVKDEGDNNLLSLLVSIFFLLILFVIIFFLAMREHRKNSAKKPEPAKFIF